MTEPKLVPVDRTHIEHWWPLIVPFLATFVGHRYLAEHVKAALEKGLLQCWLVMQGHIVCAACLTEIINYPLSREMDIKMMTGSGVETWLYLLDSLEKFAIAEGCVRMTGKARCGWSRLTRGKGYRKTHEFIEKDLVDAEVPNPSAGDSSGA